MASKAAGGKGEVPKRRKVEFAGFTLAEQSSEDGHTAADYAGAHFGSTASCKKGVSSVR